LATSLRETIMSIKLNEKQLIAVHLLASGVRASIIAKEIGIREETLSRWRQIDEFKEALKEAKEVVLREIDETHKNLLIRSQIIINEALNDEKLDLSKKANLALRYLSLIKGKDDISQKSLNNLNYHRRFADFNFEKF
jgi:transposase-like protein